VKYFVKLLLICDTISGGFIPTPRDSINTQKSLRVSENLHNQQSSTQALLIVGGRNEAGYISSVEILDPVSGQGCLLPNSLPSVRYGHSQEQYTVCGGYEENSLNKSTCLTFSDGVWKQTSVLMEERTAHVSWNFSENEGILLIGGMRLLSYHHGTELVKPDGTTEVSFGLKYFAVGSCLINEGPTFLVTGGIQTFQSVSTVSRYDKNGWIEDLDTMNYERSNHACGRFFDNNGNIVNIVAGGTTGYNDIIDNSEINMDDTRSWKLVAPLPTRLTGLKGVTFNNQFFVTGGADSNDLIKTDVYKYEDNADGNEWKRVHGMKISRADHSLDVVENFEALACDIRTTTTTTSTTTTTTTTTTTEHSKHHYFSFTIFLVLLGIICVLSVVIVILFICCCCWMGKAKSVQTQSK